LDIGELKDKVNSEISSVKNIEDIKKVRVSLLGRKGIFAEFLDRLKTIDKDRRRDAGKAINDLKIWTETGKRAGRFF
jgi:phenylalanyl-tRNA synthetase alpha subunit